MKFTKPLIGIASLLAVNLVALYMSFNIGFYFGMEYADNMAWFSISKCIDALGGQILLNGKKVK